jgi:hypothetical protein
VKIVVTDADYQAAVWKFTEARWADIKSEALRHAAERMSLETLDKIQALLPRLTETTGDEFLNISDELNRLFRLHDRAGAIAWPSSRSGRSSS